MEMRSITIKVTNNTHITMIGQLDPPKVKYFGILGIDQRPAMRTNGGNPGNVSCPHSRYLGLFRKLYGSRVT